MPTTANIGYQTILGYGDSSGGAFSSINQTVDVTGPEAETTPVKVTNVDSADAYHEFIAGLEDAGEITVSIVYLKSVMTTLRSLRRTTKWWRILFPDNSHMKAQGFITRVGMGAPLEDRMTIDVTIKLTGSLTFTAG